MDRRPDEKTWMEFDHSVEPLNLTLPSRSEYVLIARLVVAHMGQLAGFGPEEIYDLKLAVTEAATNVIRHAAVDSFQVQYKILPGEVEITVADAGAGFDTENQVPVNLEGGFGLSVIKNLVDEMDLDSDRSGTRLRMTRRIGASVEVSSG